MSICMISVIQHISVDFTLLRPEIYTLNWFNYPQMSYLQYKWVVILSQILIEYGMASQWCQTYQIIQNFKKLRKHLKFLTVTT